MAHTVMVTGADGFIGSHLTEELVKRGEKVRAFCLYNSFGSLGWIDTLPPEIRNEIDIFMGDVRDPNGVRTAMRGQERVFHLAALIAIPFSYHSPDSYVDTNIKGTLNVLNAARELDTQRVLVTSTSEVYGTAQYVPIDEKHPFQGQSPYSATKIGADRLAESFYRSFDLPVTIVRPFNTYGPRQSGRAIIPTIITQLLAGQTEIKLGSLTPTRDFNYVKDTANGFMTIADCDAAIGQELNIATGVEHSIGDLANELIAQINPNAKIVCEAERLRPEKSEVNRLLGDSTKLRNLTGWAPQYTFEQGLAATIEFLRGNLDQYKVGQYILESMENSSNKRKFSPTVWHPAARWAFVLGLCAVAGVIVSYYWRVFYGLDARGVPPLQITGLCVVVAMAAGAAALLLRHCKDFAKRGACCILLCGALFAFANPPLQTPDETDHYLRTYAISMGRFDFDAKRSYPEDVNELMDAFPGAWVNAHTSAGLGTDPDTNAEQPYNTAGYALKQYGKDGRVESIWDSFTQYLNWEKRDSAADSVTEPISFLILPFLPGALGMALARLFGFGALGCLYGGRLMNLLVYTLLCYAALRSAKKCRPAFLAVMLLPISLYMGASLSYDAALLACYYLMLALLTCPEWDSRTAAVYTAACVFANGTKPYINLLWVVLPLVVVRKNEWKARLNRAWYTVGTLAGALLLTQIVEQYGTLLRHNYGTIARQGGSTVNGGAQLLFVLKNPLRYIAVLLGTLYENDGFLGQLGLFGWKDMPVAFLNLTGPMVLLAAALLCAPKTNALGRRRNGWLSVFAAVYAVGAMTAMYITYTPVGMVRIVGLQTRYFLPVWLLLAVGVAALIRRALKPALTAERGEALALPLCGWYAFAGAVLLFQHYFIGPVYVIYQ